MLKNRDNLTSVSQARSYNNNNNNIKKKLQIHTRKYTEKYTPVEEIKRGKRRHGYKARASQNKKMPMHKNEST